MRRFATRPDRGPTSRTAPATATSTLGAPTRKEDNQRRPTIGSTAGAESYCATRTSLDRAEIASPNTPSKCSTSHSGVGPSEPCRIASPGPVVGVGTRDVHDWPDDPRSAEPDWETFEEIARRGEEHTGRIEA
jgi:hypothetical protein